MPRTAKRMKLTVMKFFMVFSTVLIIAYGFAYTAFR